MPTIFREDGPVNILKSNNQIRNTWSFSCMSETSKGGE